MSVELCHDDVSCPVGNLCCTTDACCYGLKGVTSTGVDEQNKFLLAVLILSVVWSFVYSFVLGYFPKLVKKLEQKGTDNEGSGSGGSDKGDAGNGGTDAELPEKEDDTNAALLFPHDIKLKVYPLKRR